MTSCFFFEKYLLRWNKIEVKYYFFKILYGDLADKGDNPLNIYLKLLINDFKKFTKYLVIFVTYLHDRFPKYQFLDISIKITESKVCFLKITGIFLDSVIVMNISGIISRLSFYFLFQYNQSRMLNFIFCLFPC